MDKSELRDRFIELRDDLADSDVKSWTDEILSVLSTAVDWSEMQTVHVYKSVLKWKEVNTAGVRSVITKMNPLSQITYGNPDRSMPIPDEQFDAIIIPLLVFDENLNRIGFGGGWYDRFLVTQTNAIKIGLAYDMQKVELLPVKKHDVPLDLVVTQSTVFRK